MVLDGLVRDVDRLGDNAADEAADFGRRRVGNAVIDARRNPSGVCGRWYPVILDLHRFFIAMSRVVVNHNGNGVTTPDPMVWSAGSHPKRRRLVHAVRDRALLPGPPGIWDSGWVNVPASVMSAEDIAHWLYNTGLLVEWVTFLGTLHWPAGGLDLGVGGVSYVELLLLYVLWAGERLSLEKAHPRYLRPGRPISVSAVPFGPGIDIWRSCRFIGAVMRSLCLLPGGLGRFVPCSIGANHCRLRHIGWEKRGHGLTSRPRESASEPFLDENLRLFNYPPGSTRALLAGTLPLRYCAARFASRAPTWRLPVPGQVARLVTASSGVAQEVIAEDVDHGVHWVSGSVWLALFSISRLPFLMLGTIRLQPVSAAGKVFGVGLCWMSMAPCSSLIILMLKKEIRRCFVVSLLEVSGMGFFLGKSKVRMCLVGFVERWMVMVIYFWECTFPPH